MKYWGLFLLALVGCERADQGVQAGEACEQQGELRCLDQHSAAVCVNGKYERVACEGSCSAIGGKVTCPRPNPRVGEPCFQEGAPQCSADGKALLVCETSHWKKVRDCNGALGCAVGREGARCDLGASTAGEPCSAESEGHAACTEDRKAILQCRAGKMEVASACKGALGCRLEGEHLACDSTIADPDDPCADEGASACSRDKTARLVCRSGKMAREADCACAIVGEKVACN